MRYLIAAFALLCAAPCFAQVLPTCPAPVAGVVPSNETRLTWNRAKFNDGSALPAGESYVVHGRIGGANRIALCVTAQLGAQMLNQPPGENQYAVSTRLTGWADSALSEFVSKVNSVPKTLEPPTNLTVSEDTTAFVIVKSRDRVAMVPVGTVAPGTACDSTQQVLGRYVVPRSAVTFVSSVRDEVVFGTCS
jgi:hypothetical protein